MTTVHLVSDPHSGFAGLYVDGSLLDWDLEDRAPASDLLEALFEKLPGIEYDSLSKHQLGRAIHGFDWTEYESYWPEAEVDLPVCEVEGCCVFSDAPVACCTDTVGMPVPCQHD